MTQSGRSKISTYEEETELNSEPIDCPRETEYLAAPKSHIAYQVVTSLFAIASVAYVWVSVDAYLELRASLGSSETIEIWGGEWPVSTIHAMALGGWMLIAGPYAAGVMFLQLGSIWWFRPTRVWLAVGVIVCLVSSTAIWNWVANQQ